MFGLNFAVFEDGRSEMRPIVQRAPRMRFKKPIQSALDHEYVGGVHNISRSGCMMRIKHWVKVNRELHALHLLAPMAGELHVQGEVVRAKMVPGEEGTIYEIGIRFEEGSEDYVRVSNWLKALPQEIDVQVKAGR